MSKKNIKCISCGNTTSVEKSYIGVMEKESGYIAVLDADCGVNWLCKDCHIKAKSLAKDLADLLGGKDDVYLYSILNK